MVIKEYKCPLHGFFEASHPICHRMGCDSEGVERAFLTPPGFKSDKTKFADDNLAKIARDYGLSDMSNRDGAAVKAPRDNAIWGKQGVSNYDGMMQQAAKHGGGMKVAAPAIQQRKLPPAEIISTPSDTVDRLRVMAK